MTEHPVKKYIHTFLVRFVYKFTQVILSAEMWVNGKIIFCEITGSLKFLTTEGTSAIKYGGKPDGICSDGSDMVKSLNDALKITILCIVVRSPHLTIPLCPFGRMDERAHHHLIDGEPPPVGSRVNVVIRCVFHRMNFEKRVLNNHIMMINILYHGMVRSRPAPHFLRMKSRILKRMQTYDESIRFRQMIRRKRMMQIRMDY